MAELDGFSFLEHMPATWSPYFSHVQMLFAISESDQDVMEQTREIVKVRLSAFCSLVAAFSSLQDRNWVFRQRDYTNFQVRHHFASMMFRREESETLYIILDRPNLLTESLEQMANASPTSLLHGDLSVYFEEETAVGEGVLREWFYLVCEKLFEPGRKLFVHSTDDDRRFTPDTASYHDENLLKYFQFAGRFIALALKNDVQVGVLLDHVFYLQLAGKRVSLEDIRRTDEAEYNSCLQILQLSREEFDKADLGLTFSVEIEDNLKKKLEIPLCEQGTDLAVTYDNRESYINMRIENRYVTLIKDQVSQFIQGFEEMISVPHDVFFNTLNPEDIDCLLRGKEQIAICVDEWKSHTAYVNFKETDATIKWFWQIVNEMDQETRRKLLFFWTAYKYLPMGGFKDFPEKLTISRNFDHDRNRPLPMAQTCSSQLQLRVYSGFDVMKNQLIYVTENWISTGFGIA
ncbi:hypothetical protein CARUB_v10007210mg [Capsella rubella]|uniref:HECT-type E3 ubiquitin transferase n=3 Tax=Capsella rubella TaxID=81985 RepID=R0H1W1_9BRAS|nr:hypothetical protein CARUB_v10007210mg [Capsella rubella]